MKLAQFLLMAALALGVVMFVMSFKDIQRYLAMRSM